MNKTQMIGQMARFAGINHKQAADALQAFEAEVINSLARGEEVKLVGFGTFSVKERAARNGRNPKTGVAIQIEASKAAVFKPGKPLNDAVVGSYKWQAQMDSRTR